MGLISIYMIGKGQNCQELCNNAVDQEGKSIPSSDCLALNGCEKFTYMGWFSLVFIFVISGVWLWKSRGKHKIPFSIIKKNYIERMEADENITINPMAQTFKITEENDRYVFILKSTVDDLVHYYPCEANMFTGEFGRGFGEWYTKITEAEYWFRTRKRFDVGQALNDALRKQVLRDMAIKTKQQEETLRNMGDFK